MRHCKIKHDLHELNLWKTYSCREVYSHLLCSDISESISSSYVKSITWDISAPTVTEKVHCITWCIESHSINKDEKLSNSIRQTPPVGTTMLRWVEKFNNLENVQSRIGRERPIVSEQTVQAINAYFCQRATRSLRKKVSDLGTPYSNLQNIPKSLAHTFPYKMKSTSVSKPRLCSTVWLCLIGYEQHIIRLCMLKSDLLLWWTSISRLRIWEHPAHYIWDAENPSEVQKPIFHSKSSVMCMLMVWSAHFSLKMKQSE